MSTADHVQFILEDGKRFGACGGIGVGYMDTPTPNQIVGTYQVDAPDTVLEYALSQMGKPYDYGGVLAIATRIQRKRDFRDDRSWFCSDLVAYAFERGGVPLLNVDNVNLITPRDIMLSTLLQPLN